MTTITIEDLQSVEELLTSISKITDGCKFTIDKTGCGVQVKNEAGSIRAYFHSKALMSDDSISFCLSDVKKMNRSLKLVSDTRKTKLKSYIDKRSVSHSDNGKLTRTELIAKFTADFKEKEKDYTLVYQSPYVKFKRDGISFRLATIKEDVIEYTKARPLTRELTKKFGCYLNGDIVSKVATISGITSLEKPKVYLYKQTHETTGKDFIVAEVDDKTKALSDNIGIPVSDDIEGEWTTHMCMILDGFKLFNLISCEKISVYSTKENAILVEGVNEFNSLKLIVMGLKK
jgi:hypothetical protein